MNPDDIARILDELGERLGPAGSYVFELALRQVYVNAVSSAVALTVLVIGGILVTPRLMRWVSGGDRYSSRDLVALVVGLVYGIVLLVALLFAATFIPAILNPEYAALADILSRIVPR